MYYQIKGAIFGAVPFDSDATHVLLGFLVYLVAVLLFRRSVKDWWSVLPVVILSVIMEVVDMIAANQSVAGAAEDFVLFVLLPLITTLVFRMGWAK